MSDDPYSILGVSRHATDAEIERAYDRLLNLFDPARYPGSTEDAYHRLDELNAAYAKIRDVVRDDADVSSEPEEGFDERHAAIADTLVRLGFISSAARRRSNPAVDVLATLLPEGAVVAVCVTCLGVKSGGQYECRERSASFRAVTVSRQDVAYSATDYIHPIKRTEVVLCTEDELSWTASQYAGQGYDTVTLYSIPLTDILGADVRGRRRDVVDVWIDDGPTVSIHTKPREADALCESIERAATSE